MARAAAVRRLVSPRIAAAALLALALMATAVLPASAAAGESAPGAGASADRAPAGAADDAADAAQPATATTAGLARAAIAPGSIGEIVDNLTDQLVPTRRYRGATRYDTARLIATDAFDNPANAILARGDLFPDALSGSFLAGQLDAPILLTGSDGLAADTLAALNELDPEQVTLVGGEAAIGPQVASELTQQGFATQRIGGADRFETASMVAGVPDAVIGERDGHGRTAIVARADEFADALVAGTLSYTADFPLLLTTGDRLHPDTANTLSQQSIDHVIVPGGQAAVSQGVVDQIESRGIDVRRVAGADRVATSVNFAEFMRDELGFGLDRINTAIGTRFPDALALGPLSGPAGQPVLLTANETTLGGDGAVQQFLSQTCSIDLAGIAGGHAAIGTALEGQIRELATSTGAPCQLGLQPTVAGRDLGAEHTLTGTLTDNGGRAVVGQDVRVEVYRATDLQLPADVSLDDLDLSGLGELDSSLPLGQLLDQLNSSVDQLDLDAPFGGEPAETFTATTDADGQVSVTYTGPDSLALDVAVACRADESDSCALLSGGDVVPDTNLLTASAITLWAVQLDLPNLLLLDPPAAAATSGSDHQVTATALSADPASVGSIGGLSGFDDPAGLLSQLLDPAALSDIGELGLGGIGDLAGNLPAGVGSPVTDTTVRFEAYRATDLIESALGDLGALEDLGNLGQTTELGQSPDVASVVQSLDIETLLTELLGGLSSGEVLGAVQPVATGEDTTDANGQATFDYAGPDGTLPGLDVVVACFPDQPGQACTAVSGGQLALPDQPGVGVATATWLPAVLDSVSPLAATGDAGGGHSLDASALRLDGQPAEGAPVRWDVYRTDQTQLVTSLVGQLLDRDALVDEVVNALLAGSASDLIDQAALDGAVAGNLPDALDTAALETDLTSALDTELGALDLQGLVGQLAEDGLIDGLLGLLDGGLLSQQADAGQATTQQLTSGDLGENAQTLLDALMGTTEVQTAIDDAVASLSLTDYVDDASLLDGVAIDDVLDTAAVDDLIANPDTELVTALSDVLGGLDVDQLLAQLDPADVRDAVTGHVTGGVVDAGADGRAQIDYDGPAGAGLDVIVACVGQQREDCAILGGGGLTRAAGSGLSIPLAASQLWAGPGAVEGALGDLTGLTDQVTTRLQSLSPGDLDVLQLVDVGQLGELDTLIADSDQLALTGLAEQQLIADLQGLGLIDGAGTLLLDALQSLLDDEGLLGLLSS